MADADAWVIGPIHLRYRLGPYTLHRRRMTFAVRDVHFSLLPADPDAIRPPFERYGSEIAGALVPGQPMGDRLAFPRISLLPDAIRYVPTQGIRYYVELSGSFEGYLAKFSSKTRSTLKRKVRRLAERSGGSVDWREYRTPEELDAFYALARTVAARTYQEQLLDAGLPETPDFQEELRTLARAGNARGYLLFLDGRPIAYLFCPLQQGAVLYEHLGYDPVHRELSPGTVLQYHVLERLFAEGIHSVFDFTEGEGEHKRLFSTSAQRCADVYLFRRTVANALTVAVHAALAALTRAGGAVLGRAGLRDRVRRHLRWRHVARATPGPAIAPPPPPS